MSKKHDKFLTLMDEVYAWTHREDTSRYTLKNKSLLRQDLFSAKRFVLDDDMSYMLGELQQTAFHVRNKKLQARAVDALRVSARLPHRITWVEFNLHKDLEAVRDFHRKNPGHYPDNPEVDPFQAPRNEGWLLIQHPQIETAFEAHLFLRDPRPDDFGYSLWMHPWSYLWRTDNEGPLPWKDGFHRYKHGDKERPISRLLVGGDMYDSPYLATRISPFNTGHDIIRDGKQDHLMNLLTEWTGCIRRIWALLATVNDLPVSLKEVVPAKGFMAGRNYKKFLTHRTITLTVPRDEYRKVARAAVAIARRKAHHVRGHWRDDWRFPGDGSHRKPEQHFWRDDRTCECGARRIWVHEHDRGDATLGWVTHDYKIERGAPKPLNPS